MLSVKLYLLCNLECEFVEIGYVFTNAITKDLAVTNIKAHCLDKDLKRRTACDGIMTLDYTIPVEASPVRRGRKALLNHLIKSVDCPDYCNEIMPLNMTTLMPLYM